MDGQHMTWSTCRVVELKAIQREPDRNDSADKASLAQGADGGCFQSSRRLDPPKTRTGLDRDHFSTTQEPPPLSLCGVTWREKLYSAVRLTFGRRSSPEIFDLQSEALCCCRDLSFLSFPFYSDSLISPYCSALYILSLSPPPPTPFIVTPWFCHLCLFDILPWTVLTCVPLTSCINSPCLLLSLLAHCFLHCLPSLWIQVYCRMLSKFISLASSVLFLVKFPVLLSVLFTADLVFAYYSKYMFCVLGYEISLVQARVVCSLSSRRGNTGWRVQVRALVLVFTVRKMQLLFPSWLFIICPLNSAIHRCGSLRWFWGFFNKQWFAENSHPCQITKSPLLL